MVISYFLVMSVGMGMTMAPATESVMGSLPRAKAGVGSAVNDTTRQVGGALGVAIIGTIVSSAYAGNIADIGRRFGLGASDLDAAESSLGGAQRIAPSLGERSDAFVSAANDGFVHCAQHRPADLGRDHRVRNGDGVAIPALARPTSGVDEARRTTRSPSAP